MVQSEKIIETPIISVLMSIYKEPLEWVEESINSILNQTFSDFEFIIVNDYPTSVDLSKFLYDYSQKDKRIKIISNPENIGLTKSLNIGLKLCKGKYIARMDADDISLPERFAKQVKFMESHPDVIVCGTNIKLIGKFKPFYIKSVFQEDKDIRGQMLYNSGFVHPTVFIRKSILDKSGIIYDETFQNAQDYKMWYDLRRYGKFANIKDCLLKYRISNIQITSASATSQQLNRNIISSLFQRERNTLDKVMEAYYMRYQAYQSNNLYDMIKVILSRKTAITIKERLALTVKCIINTN